MNSKLGVIFSLILGQSLTINAAWCDTNPEGLCIERLNENDSKIRAWFDKKVYFETLLVGYDIKSDQGWSSVMQQSGIYTEWNIARRADYNNGKNESVWFSAYRARGASCWKRSELLYFHENWAGTNFIQKPHDWPDSQAAQVTYQDMIDRVSEQGMLFDNSGQLVAFCADEAKVSASG
ncbi:hypothetical protein MHN79_17555 [Vibrio sp. Of14-4]|uniref:Uncharacterized protein n=1 Tax=Vibrio tetraodonis subsp. pristinus TaxID=2695891 RepID=A0A6L8LYY6_9VIBR|nr:MULTISPECIES: hypothetical protein [Vibrio]MCG7491296.1 hypothetical protein [Vibrio sp. Of14-4]MYM61344.1 hypothetical protein [Vibrio tetraodonis subsp. pristinus]